MKIGGFRVELGEIEHTIRRQDGVQEAIVQALGDRENRCLNTPDAPVSDCA